MGKLEAHVTFDTTYCAKTPEEVKAVLDAYKKVEIHYLRRTLGEKEKAKS